ncbi:LysR family transcriptional regulator [Luteimonas sp. BDR2-5]|uniref:LysR family transcriptional regulator n=1 Tax=Proluteimonas luteida TaxID=2878685 RepID=UPI001E5A18CA|nr:LysR family transcriptional regulator [Luteimonas sp. BDR2-5]MCD9028549.1 LysR family transcriptional regulator [Luteimonas sp. BDR2-5]
MSNERLPPLTALRAFEAAARLGSIGRAAAELHVTHGAVSRQIKALEAHLDLPLFQRDGRGVRLTPAGERLRDAAGSAFAQLQASVRALRRDATPQALVLGCPGSLLARWVIPRLDRLARDLPGLRLHLSAHEGDFDPALPDLDAALLIGQPPWPPGWRVRTLADERIGPVLSPRHPRFDALAHAPADALLQEPLLHTASRPQAWPQWAARQGLDPAGLRMGTGFEHLYYLLEAAASGLGVAIAPAQLVADDIDAGRLAAPWGFVGTGAHWCLCTQGAGADGRFDTLADWLAGQLAQA